MNGQPQAEDPLMKLKVLLPYRVFLVKADVSSLVAKTQMGFFGILPHRVDCVAALVPGILSYKDTNGLEGYVAVDDGVLIKAGFDVTVSVRNAVGGADLKQLRDRVEVEFAKAGARDKETLMAISKRESEFIGRLSELRHG